MKSEKRKWFVILTMFFLISGCQDDKGKNDYSGVSELISERNSARYEIAENAPKKAANQKKKTEQLIKEPKPGSEENQKELTSIILYEENVNIVGSDSGRTLAKGVAYVNKKGQIVRIKILKE